MLRRAIGPVLSGLAMLFCLAMAATSEGSDIIWYGLLAAGALFEFICFVWLKRATFSDAVWRKTKSAKAQILLAAFFAWLTWHFTLGRRKEDGEAAVLVAAVVTGSGAIVAISASDALDHADKVIGIVVILLGGATWINKRWNKRLESKIDTQVLEEVQALETRMLKRLEALTAPLQPEANGGASLPDLNRRVLKLEGTVEAVSGEVRDANTKLDTLLQFVKP